MDNDYHIIASCCDERIFHIFIFKILVLKWNNGAWFLTKLKM